MNSGKRRSGGIVKVLLIVFAVLIIAAAAAVASGAVTSLLGYPTKKQCKVLINNFQDSCNSLDAEGIVDCLDPTIASPLKKVLFVSNVLTSSTTDALVTILEALGGVDLSFTDDTGLDLSDAFQILSITPEKFEFYQKGRKVYCAVSVASVTQYLNIYIEKEDGAAYIAKVELAE